MTRPRRNPGPGGEDCTPLMDYAPRIMDCLDNGILHGETDFGDYSRIRLHLPGTCHIPGCDEASSPSSRYCEGHEALGRYCRARARHQMEIARTLLAQRKGKAQDARQTS